VLQTGASESEIPESLPIDAFVRKPFDVRALLALLREVVAPRPDAPEQRAEIGH
jgi:hypothetical protein